MIIYNIIVLVYNDAVQNYPKRDIYRPKQNSKCLNCNDAVQNYISDKPGPFLNLQSGIESNT